MCSSIADNIFADVDVLIMAAGVGSRMGGSIRKQWLTIFEQPLFWYTAERFRLFGATSVILVVHPEDVAAVNQFVAERNHHPVYSVCVGGSNRQESVYCGLAQTKRPFVAVHDAARPFICEQDVLRVIAAARQFGAVTLGHPVRDTLKRTTASGKICETVERENAWQVQTPQVFLRQELIAAHERAREAGYSGTDDTALLERIGVTVQIVPGSAWNVKITEPEDLLFMRWREENICVSD